MATRWRWPGGNLSDHERQLIAYEIHDGLAQELAGAIVQFQVYVHARETTPKDAAKAFDAGMTMTRRRAPANCREATPPG